MAEILQFKVNRAEAQYNSGNGSLNLNFYYPRNPPKLEGRLRANPEFGIVVLEKLIKNGYSEIATPENPISPPNAGSLPVTKDGKFICNRRDDGAKVHKMYNSPYSGFANSIDELFTKEGMMKLGARESAEEVIFITRDRNPYLIVTPSLRYEILNSAKRLGINYPIREIRESFLEGKDILNVFYEDGEPIFSMKTFFTMLWDIDASTIAMQIRILDIHSEEILPIDAEGIFDFDRDTGVSYYNNHFNRESFIVDPKNIAIEDKESQNLDGLKYVHPMKNVEVFQSYWDETRKMRIVYTPKNSPLEYLGPGGVSVTESYLWAPQDTLRACLDGLEVPGYYGKKLHWELEIDKKFANSRKEGKIDESCIIPERFLAMDN